MPEKRWGPKEDKHQRSHHQSAFWRRGIYAVNFWKSHNVLLWGELSILVYPMKSMCYLRITEYFNAIYICDCLSNVTPGPEDEQKCWRKTLGSSGNDYHLHDTWCFTLSYKQSITDHSLPWCSQHNMPQGASCFHIRLDSGSLNMLVLHWFWVTDQHQTLDLLNSDPGCLKLDYAFSMNRFSHLRDSE